MRNQRYRNISKSDKILIILFLLTIGLIIGSVLTAKLVQKNRPQNEFLDFVLVEEEDILDEELVDDLEDEVYTPGDKPNNNPSGDGTTNKPSNKPKDKPNPPVEDPDPDPEVED